MDEPGHGVAELAEQGRPLERLAPRAGAVRGGVAAVWLHELGEPRDPGNRRVADVPEEAEPATGPQDAVDLAKRLVSSEPVERLADGDGVHSVGAERDRLGSPG